MRLIVLLFAALGFCAPVVAQPAASAFDPLSISVDQRDADRFAALMRETDYRPTAAQLQARYLDGAGRGVEVFTPGRIENAANLAQAIAGDRERYRYAVETCLPLVASTNAEMRSIYLAYRGLLPELPLPSVHVVFGAGNSGGTAGPGAQVLGLEVLCGPGTTEAQFRQTMRSMFAHETVHSWQPGDNFNDRQDSEMMLFFALREGVPDYLATLVTGTVLKPELDRWAREREGWLWAEFQRDRQRVQVGRTSFLSTNADGQAAMRRWIGNYGNPPEGWPIEAGYWVGMRIAAAYVERSPDRAAAIRALIALDDPAAILAASGYAPTN